jgi:hypothetical protein
VQKRQLAASENVAHDRQHQLSGESLAAGAHDPSSAILNSGWSSSFGFAPAIEYNLTSTLGVIVGMRLVPAGHNSSSSVAPVVAINFVR